MKCIILLIYSSSIEDERNKINNYISSLSDQLPLYIIFIIVING